MYEPYGYNYHELPSEREVIIQVSPYDKINFRLVRNSFYGLYYGWDRVNAWHLHRKSSSDKGIWVGLTVTHTSIPDFVRLYCDRGWNPNNYHKDGCGLVIEVPNKRMTEEELRQYFEDRGRDK